MAHGYNPDFYMTCATVIPVFLIAVIVPGGAMSRLSDQLRSQNPNTWWFETKSAFANLGLMAAFFGETTALAALRFQRTFWGSTEVPAIAVTWLVIMTAWGAAWIDNRTAADRRGEQARRGTGGDPSQPPFSRG